MLQAQNVNSRRRMRGRCGTNRRVLPCHQNTARFGQNTFFEKVKKFTAKTPPTQAIGQKSPQMSHQNTPKRHHPLGSGPTASVANRDFWRLAASINAPTLIPKQPSFLTNKPRLPLLLAVPASPALVISGLAFGASRLRRNPCRKMAAKSIKLPHLHHPHLSSSPAPCFLRLSFFP